MESTLQEKLCIDIELDIKYAIYEALQNTISHAIDAEMQRETAPLVSRERILSNFLAHNIDQVDDDCYMTQGPNNKLYLCGNWLIRPILHADKMIPMMEYIIVTLACAHVDMSDIVFCPEKTGIAMRKSLWPLTNEQNSSYDVPKRARNSFGEKNELARPLGAGGPPQGMPPFGAGRPPFGAPPAGGMPPEAASVGSPPQGQ